MKRTILSIFAAAFVLGVRGESEVDARPPQVVSRLTGKSSTLVRMEILPFVPTVERGGLLQLRAFGWTSGGARQNVTQDVAWEVSPTSRGSVDSLDRLVGGEPGSARVTARLGSLRTGVDVEVLAKGRPDWDVTHVEQMREEGKEGGSASWCVHVKNYGTADAPPVEVEWRVDGRRAAGGRMPKLQRFNQTELILKSPDDGRRHDLEVVVDPENTAAETSKANNRLAVSSDALAVGFWVEESTLRYFHRHQPDLGIGSNSWEDWAQRQITFWNHTGGQGDRWRLDRIVVVGDGVLPMAGGSAVLTPDRRAKGLDLMRGFPAYDAARNDLYRRTSQKSLDNPFYIERALMEHVASVR